MEERNKNLQFAENYILKPILEEAKKQYKNTILISLEGKDVLLVEDSRCSLPEISLNQLENQLNLLMQYSKIENYKNKLSGNAYEVYLTEDIVKANCKIIPLNYRKAA